MKNIYRRLQTHTNRPASETPFDGKIALAFLLAFLSLMLINILLNQGK